MAEGVDCGVHCGGFVSPLSGQWRGGGVKTVRIVTPAPAPAQPTAELVIVTIHTHALNIHLPQPQSVIYFFMFLCWTYDVP